MEAEADSTRLIPPFNAEAGEASEVYALHDIIPEVEWKAISASPFKQAASDRDRVHLLPYKRSNWVNQRLALTFKQESPSKREMYVLFPRPP